MCCTLTPHSGTDKDDESEAEAELFDVLAAVAATTRYVTASHSETLHENGRIALPPGVPSPE